MKSALVFVFKTGLNLFIILISSTSTNKLCKIIAAVNNPRRVLGERRGENFHEVRGGEKTPRC